MKLQVGCRRREDIPKEIPVVFGGREYAVAVAIRDSDHDRNLKEGSKNNAKRGEEKADDGHKERRSEVEKDRGREGEARRTGDGGESNGSRWIQTVARTDKGEGRNEGQKLIEKENTKGGDNRPPLAGSCGGAGGSVADEQSEIEGETLISLLGQTKKGKEKESGIFAIVREERVSRGDFERSRRGPRVSMRGAAVKATRSTRLKTAQGTMKGGNLT